MGLFRRDRDAELPAFEEVASSVRDGGQELAELLKLVVDKLKVELGPERVDDKRDDWKKHPGAMTHLREEVSTVTVRLGPGHVFYLEHADGALKTMVGPSRLPVSLSEWLAEIHHAAAELEERQALDIAAAKEVVEHGLAGTPPPELEPLDIGRRRPSALAAERHQIDVEP